MQSCRCACRTSWMLRCPSSTLELGRSAVACSCPREVVPCSPPAQARRREPLQRRTVARAMSCSADRLRRLPAEAARPWAPRQPKLTNQDKKRRLVRPRRSIRGLCSDKRSIGSDREQTGINSMYVHLVLGCLLAVSVCPSVLTTAYKRMPPFFFFFGRRSLDNADASHFLACHNSRQRSMS